jgi:Undecaprenyl-phosphate glucose phosphotransferase
MLKRRHQLFVVLFVIADGLMIAAASLAAWAIRIVAHDQPWPTDWESYVKDPLLLFTVPLALAVMQALRLYTPQRDRPLRAEQTQILKASVIAAACVVLFLWLAGNDLIASDARAIPDAPLGLSPARLQIAALAVALPFFVGLQRLALRLALRQLRRRGLNRRHVAIIGTGRLAQRVARTLARNSWTGLKVSYFISHHPSTARTQCLERPVVGGLDDLDQLLAGYPVDAVYIAMPATLAGAVPDLLARLERFTVNVRYVPDINPKHMPERMQFAQLEGMPILSYRENPTLGLGGITKRTIDIAGALVGLLLLSPVLLLIAIAIRLTSPGRVLFKQSRVSVGSDEFKIYKFRTMRSDSCEASPSWTQRDDPRVTPLGRFLRRTSLDELPQLFNVLRGEMSLVGPRPERPELVERFRDRQRGYVLRQHVKAGMTGWAQINGLRGDTCLRKRLQYDLFYIRNWSIWFDIRILFATIIRGFVHHNAH